MEIIPRGSDVIVNDASNLHDPDIAIFVSPNSVQHGLAYAGSARTAAVGPATAAAIESAGRRIDIRSSEGYDSEHLLAEPGLQDVSGQIVRIVRADYSAAKLDNLEQQWRSGEVNVVTIMSVESFANLVAILPEWCRTELENTPLVTPASRVIIEAFDRFPGIPTTLARGPQASEMVDAIVQCKRT
jgi:uroporphyrinogen-III synthase